MVRSSPPFLTLPRSTHLPALHLLPDRHGLRSRSDVRSARRGDRPLSNHRKGPLLSNSSSLDALATLRARISESVQIAAMGASPVVLPLGCPPWANRLAHGHVHKGCFVLRIHAERLRRGWTQTDLAYRARGLSPADISRIENGWLVPYPRQREALSKALEIAADRLLEEVTRDEN